MVSLPGHGRIVRIRRTAASLRTFSILAGRDPEALAKSYRIEPLHREFRHSLDNRHDRIPKGHSGWNSKRCPAGAPLLRPAIFVGYRVCTGVHLRKAIVVRLIADHRLVASVARSLVATELVWDDRPALAGLRRCTWHPSSMPAQTGSHPDN